MEALVRRTDPKELSKANEILAGAANYFYKNIRTVRDPKPEIILLEGLRSEEGMFGYYFSGKLVIDPDYGINEKTIPHEFFHHVQEALSGKPGIPYHILTADQKAAKEAGPNLFAALYMSRTMDNAERVFFIADFLNTKYSDNGFPLDLAFGRYNEYKRAKPIFSRPSRDSHIPTYAEGKAIALLSIASCGLDMHISARQLLADPAIVLRQLGEAVRKDKDLIILSRLNELKSMHNRPSFLLKDIAAVARA